MPEVLKRIDMDDINIKFANKIHINGDLLDQLATINFISVPKSGDLSKTNNYKGIAFTSLVSKLINRMIRNQICPKIDSLEETNVVSDLVDLQHFKFYYGSLT